MTIAFFDLDNTLLSFNSASRWVRAERRAGHLSIREAMTALYWIGRYHLGLAEIDAAIRVAIGTLAGQREQDLAARTEDFYATHIRGHIRPGAHAVLRQHRDQGDRLVLLTSTSAYLSRLVATELRLDDFLCTRFVVTHGRFTGEALDPLCFGPGKVAHAQAFAAQTQTHLADCSYYADSMADVPMFEQVGHPVVVNPDWRLRRLARARQWPVMDWGQC